VWAEVALTRNLYIAAVLFFGWFAVDSIMSLFGNPLEGLYYPMASGRLKQLPHDWTQKPWFGAPLYLAIFATIWILFIRREGPRKGARLAALTTGFIMAPFWIVSLVSADMYGLEINSWWAWSMAYANASFLFYGFVGSGRSEDLRF
jgi:hypothetical protein